MKFEFKHYRRAPGSSNGVLVGRHDINGPDANAAVIFSWCYLAELRDVTDYAILKDDHRGFIRGWGVAMEPAAFAVA